MNNKKNQNNVQAVGRREFLKTAGLSAFGFIGGSLLPAGMMSSLAGIPLAHAANSDHTLIFVFCRGGVDALSMFPPIQPQLRQAYEASRPYIKADVVPLAPGLDFGIHKDLSGLRTLWNRGHMSVIYGIGGVTNATSHFNQMNLMEGGSSKRRLSTGFLQRFAAHLPQTAYGDLVAVERNIPRSLSGPKFVLQYGSHAELANISGAGVTPGLTKVERLANNYYGNARLTLIASELSKAATLMYPRLVEAGASNMPLANFSEIARLMKLPIPPKVITTTLDGWDFHRDLKEAFDDTVGTNSPANLSASLLALSESMSADRWQKTTVVVISEFGRRIVQNGALGADHGRGGIALVLGGAIAGGRMVHRPDLAPRLLAGYASGGRAQAQIPVDFDFRILLGEIFKRRFGLLETQIHGSETAVFPENYRDVAQVISPTDVGPSLSLISGLYSSYDPNAASARFAALFGGPAYIEPRVTTSTVVPIPTPVPVPDPVPVVEEPTPWVFVPETTGA